jgi:putative ABC transport system permease protein
VGSDPGTWRTVVGIVEDITNRGLRQAPVEEVYLSLQHFPLSTVAFAVRTRQDPQAIASAVVREVGPLLAGVPVYDVATMDDRLADSVGIQRMAATAMRGLALVAFLLAVTGLYGVLAYLVARRTHEFGIRLALGAQPGNVIAMLLRQAMGVVGLGVVLGLVLGVAAAQFIRGQLHGVSTVDPMILGIVALVVMSVGALAACVPAHRGSRADPMVALQSD